MRILVLGINYWPDEAGIADFTTRRCEYLAEQGHEIVVVTGFPYYPQWRIADEYRGRLYTKEIRRGVTILRCALYVPRRVTAIRRILHEASFVASSTLRALSTSPPSILFVVSPPLGLSLAAQLLSSRWRIPYVYHVEDLQPDAALDLGMLPAGRVGRLLYAVERIAYRRAAMVSTLTAAMRERIVSKGIDESKVRVFPQWSDADLFGVRSEEDRLALRRRFGFEGRFVALYGGTMGVKQGLGTVLDAAALCNDANDLFVLVGDGAERAILERKARERTLRNVRFVPVQPKSVFVEMLSAADVSLLTQQRSVADIVFPSKVVTLFAAGSPLVASVTPESEVARVVRESGGGIVVPPEDPRALLGAIEQAKVPGHRQALSAAARMYAQERWDPRRVLPAMESALAQISMEGGGHGTVEDPACP